ncbi:carbohydrate esterase family 3 protein [Chaetomium sp. MPI-CAGE-AT-0009]|nr:carbohydrate esterase family 3 protein [Chaetomium sp. MPI-CAGE-AT-0009]
MGIAEKDKNEIKVMVVGDSISHGREGDWTWRYRIWEWFIQEGINVRFVGPYKGTVPPDEPHPPRPPRLEDEPPQLPAPLRTDGGYAAGVHRDFLSNCHHFAACGQQAYLAKDLVAEQVAAYQPDLCLVQLGFNDLGWRMCGPVPTLASIGHLIEKARSAKPDLKFAVANVPQRTDIPGREDLPRDTDLYNRMLAQGILGWNTLKSPVALVCFCENYSCGGTNSDAAYDGLHPNALGEYQIAQAFSRTLVSDFSLGRHPLAIPESVPSRPLPIPDRFRGASTPGGVVVSWDTVYGALGYDLQHKLANDNEWTTTHIDCNRYYWPPLRNGQLVECRIRTSGGDNLKSPWSYVVLAIAKPETPPPPSNMVTHATATGFTITWEPPPPSSYTGEIDRYGLIYFDCDQPGVFPGIVGVRGNKAELKGLTPGHRYAIAMESWSTVGQGLPGGAPSVVVGGSIPAIPTSVRVKALDCHNVELGWPPVIGATGYGIWVHYFGADGPTDPVLHSSVNATVWDAAPSKSQLETSEVWVLHPAWHHKFAVTAFNDNGESRPSTWLTPPRSSCEEFTVPEDAAIHIHLRQG